MSRMTEDRTVKDCKR